MSRNAVKEHYQRCLSEGTSPKLAEMFATGQPPACMTDSVFLEGHCNGNQFESTPYLGDHYKQVAESHGQDVKGKVYKAGLARFPGDPLAWISGRGDVQRICETRGLDCEGAVTINARRPRGVAGVDIADDILEEKVQDLLEKSVEPLQESRQELKEKIKDKIKPHWKKRTE